MQNIPQRIRSRTKAKQVLSVMSPAETTMGVGSWLLNLRGLEFLFARKRWQRQGEWKWKWKWKWPTNCATWAGRESNDSIRSCPIYRDSSCGTAVFSGSTAAIDTTGCRSDCGLGNASEGQLGETGTTAILSSGLEAPTISTATSTPTSISPTRAQPNLLSIPTLHQQRSLLYPCSPHRHHRHPCRKQLPLIPCQQRQSHRAPAAVCKIIE